MRGCLSLLACLFALPCATTAAHAADAGTHPAGRTSFELVDASRRDQIRGEARRWRVDLYYPARPGSGREVAYAHDGALLAHMRASGYYEAGQAAFDAWSRQPSPARVDARALPGEWPLVVLLPGSGVAGFHYSRLASALVGRGYAVAFLDLPYLGLSRLGDGRIRTGSDDPVQRLQDPRTWRPRVADWARDVSVSLDRLAAMPSMRAVGLRLDLVRVLVVGHSIGGTVAAETCGREARASACADFEGMLEASSSIERGGLRPVLQRFFDGIPEAKAAAAPFGSAPAHRTH